jgi:hypothetical protein
MSADIYIPGRLSETDPILWEAMCLCESLVRLGYVGEAVCGPIENPRSAMWFEHTKQGDMCLCIRVRAEVAEKEVRIIAADLGPNGEQIAEKTKITETGVPHTKTVELMIAVGPLRCTPEEFPARWLSAMSALRSAPNEVVEPLYKMSRSCQSIHRIAEMLKQKGFEARR